MHTQFEKCAYVRNHGHNNMGCGHAPHGGACPHKSIPLHFQTLFFMMVTVVSLLALSIYYSCSLWSPSISILTLVVLKLELENLNYADMPLLPLHIYQLKIVQVYVPTTSHSDDETAILYNIIDTILEQQTHYPIVMGNLNAKVGGQTNTSERETARCFGLGQRNERGATLVEWATSKYFKIMNTQFQKKAGRRWTWKSPDWNTKNEIDYIMIDTPSMVNDVPVINRVNIGSDHMMLMCSRVERRNLLNKNTQTRTEKQGRSTSITWWHIHVYTLNKNMTEIIQQRATRIGKQTKKPKKVRISYPTRALTKKHRGKRSRPPRDHIEYVETCKAIKHKAREDIRKHNLDEIRETI